MAPKKSAKKKGGKGTLVAVEVGAAALAAAAAAGYYFYGTKNAKKHRHAASSWAKGLKKDVVKRAKSLKNLNAAGVSKAVDQAVAAYAGARGVAQTDLMLAAKELKQNWSAVARELAPSAKVKSVVKKATKKVGMAKKSAKKTSKKAAKSTKRRR